MKMACIPVLCLGVISINNCNPNAIQGSGVSKTETRSVAAFSKIELSGSPDVDVTVGPETSVSVTADDNVLPLIRTKLDGETLNIDSDGSYNTRIGVKVKIIAPKLDGISISGSGNVRATGVKAESLDARIAGSGNIDVSGVAGNLEAQITGSGNLRASNLESKHAHVTVTGSGDASVRATEELDAAVTGSGDVHYSGNPAHVGKSVTGSGDISAR